MYKYIHLQMYKTVYKVFIDFNKTHLILYLYKVYFLRCKIINLIITYPQNLLIYEFCNSAFLYALIFFQRIFSVHYIIHIRQASRLIKASSMCVFHLVHTFALAIIVKINKDLPVRPLQSLGIFRALLIPKLFRSAVSCTGSQ